MAHQLTRLENTLAEVLRSDSWSEELDKLPNSLFQDKDRVVTKRADYLLMQRKLIVEVKSVNSERVVQLEKWLNNKVNSDTWLQSNWIGTVEIETLFSKHPDGDQLKREALNFFYKSALSNWINGAMPQLRNTKDKLNLPDATCGVIILNEKDASIEVEDFTIAISEYIGRREANGERTCRPIDFVLIISETSREIAAGISRQSLIIHEEARTKQFIKWYFKNDFGIKWAAHCGQAVIDN